jgi:micrococcal nuclease
MRLAALIAPLALAAAGAAAGAPHGATARVARVVDGDTIALTSGARVRLVQIDTPEVGSGECYSRAAARDLRRLLPVGSVVSLEADGRLDSIDRYGRLLRYVWYRGKNVNLELVRNGSATVWMYGGVSGKYAPALLSAGRSARAAHRGLWGACKAVWDPYGPARTSPKTVGGGSALVGECDPSYPDVCISSPPPDLDCADVPYTHFRVVGADPHRFDGDRDGVGCEG